jgi:hypothetical protein
MTMTKSIIERRYPMGSYLEDKMMLKLERGRGKLSSGVAKMSKVGDYYHLFPSIKVKELIDQAGGRVMVAVKHDENRRPLAIHLTPSLDGDHELKKPRQGRAYLPLNMSQQFGLSAKSVTPAQAVKETITDEGTIVVEVPTALCPTD